MADPSIREKVLKEIDKAEDEIFDFVRRLIQFKSINAMLTNDGKPMEEEACQQFVARKLGRLNMEVDIWEHDPLSLEKFGRRYVPRQSYKNRPVLVGTLKGAGDGGKSLILSGHIDVVPADPEDAWSFDPWIGEIVDGKLYGRGAADMKGGIGSMIYAIECIQRAGVTLKGDLQVHSTLDEEMGNMGSLCVLDRGYRADACVVVEATHLDIQSKHKGILWLRVDVRGRSTHAQIPTRHWTMGGGVSAIDKAIYLIEGLDRLNNEWAGHKKTPPRPDKLDPDNILSVGTIDVGVIHGGTQPHIIPETCYFRADIQYLPHEADKQGMGTKVAAEVEDYLTSLAMADPWLKENRPTIVWESDADGSATPIDHEFVKMIIQSVQEAGQQGRISGVVPCCDMSRYVNVAHIPTVIYGPGHVDQCHSIDEYIELDQITGATKGLASTILNWCGYK